MAGKRNILFILTALILIPIMLGQTPVKFVQKLGSGCPLDQNKVALSCDPCMYNSVTSQSESSKPTLAALPSSDTILEPALLLAGETVDSAVSIISNSLTESPPLRC